MSCARAGSGRKSTDGFPSFVTMHETRGSARSPRSRQKSSGRRAGCDLRQGSARRPCGIWSRPAATSRLLTQVTIRQSVERPDGAVNRTCGMAVRRARGTLSARREMRFPRGATVGRPVRMLRRGTLFAKLLSRGTRSSWKKTAGTHGPSRLRSGWSSGTMCNGCNAAEVNPDIPIGNEAGHFSWTPI